jgi:hypothetical protein
VALGIESAALAITGLIGVMAALGRFAEWFVGAEVWRHLLPFAAAVLALAVAVGGLLWAWTRMRRWLEPYATWVSPTLAVMAASGSIWFATQPAFERDVAHLQALVGGQAAAERAAIAHQVFAAYRRAHLAQWERLYAHAAPYAPPIDAAAAAFAIDRDLLMGLAATESSFRPRHSTDGGQGLFQITAPPAQAVAAARAALGVKRLDVLDHRHNAFIGAATLRGYLDQMRGDLFLGLLAYNIGPRNGGLQAIMQQYGARDFVTIQPYLQQLPRDYPIRVLSAALAYRLWRIDGRLPRYEEGANARRIQQVGIPGLS